MEIALVEGFSFESLMITTVRLCAIASGSSCHFTAVYDLSNPLQTILFFFKREIFLSMCVVRIHEYRQTYQTPARV